MQLSAKGKFYIMHVITHISTSNHHRIPIHERVELPDELIPSDSRVEIDAKITAGKSCHQHNNKDGPLTHQGYFTAGKRLTAEELQSVQGRLWEE